MKTFNVKDYNNRDCSDESEITEQTKENFQTAKQSRGQNYKSYSNSKNLT
jgi:hypothetical protein